MPIVDFESRISSRFQCMHPNDAAPAHKHFSALPSVYDARTPHVKMDFIIGTRGAFVDRVDMNYYQGHVPDAPVLLGPSQLETYKAGEKACGWGPKLLTAMSAAAAVGAIAGGVVCSAILLFSSALHVLWPTVFAGFAVAQCVFPVVVFMIGGASLFVINDSVEWILAQKLFAEMARFAACQVQLESQVRRQEENDESATLIAHARTNPSWVIQQAGLELEGARARADMRPVQSQDSRQAQSAA